MDVGSTEPFDLPTEQADSGDGTLLTSCNPAGLKSSGCLLMAAFCPCLIIKMLLYDCCGKTTPVVAGLEREAQGCTGQGGSFPFPDEVPAPTPRGSRLPIRRPGSFISFVALLGEGFPGGSVGKNPRANARVTGSIPGSGRSPGDGNSPLQYSFLGNPTEEPGRLCIAHGVAKTWTQFSS